MRHLSLKIVFVFFLTALLAGCGSKAAPFSSNRIVQVTLFPQTISVVAGQVVTVTPSAIDAANDTVSTALFTFTSSNTNIATISPRGEICGGVWDSTFVVCRGTDSTGAPIAGAANVTATSSGITSSPVKVSVHPQVTSIIVDPITPAGACFSVNQTHQFTAHACSTQVTPHDTTGPCAPNAKEITSEIGSFNWITPDASIATPDPNGLVTAHVPGLTNIVATVGTTTSPATAFRACMPVKILLHLNGDTAGPSESATMNVNDSKTLQADMVDENGTSISPAPVAILTNNPVTTTVSGLTLTASSPGGAGIQAACAPPTCGVGINEPIYSNLFSVNVNGTSPATTVWATSSFAPPSGTSPTIVPIDTSKTPPTAGTAINLPGVPNSLLFAPNGTKAFLGTNNGLVVLDPAANTATLFSAVAKGKVLAVSPDGNRVILSNAAVDPATGSPIEPNGPSQRVFIADAPSSSVLQLILPGAVAATFNTDGFKAYIVSNVGNTYVFSPVLTTQTVATGGTSTDVAQLPSGAFDFIANSSGLQVIAACNNAVQASAPPTNSTNIQLVRPILNSDTMVAMDSTATVAGLDVITATVTPLAPPVAITAANCPPNVSYSNQFLDFGLGPISARQLLPATNGSRIVVLPSGINKVLVAVGGSTPSVSSIALPAGATEPFTGGLTPDGNTLWTGVGGKNTVDRVNLSSGADDLQIATSFKKSDGTAAPPDLVAVRPK